MSARKTARSLLAATANEMLFVAKAAADYDDGLRGRTSRLVRKRMTVVPGRVDSRRVGVLLVHGIAHNGAAFADLQARLEGLGYPTSAVTYGTFSGNIERFADRIERQARTLAADTGVDAVVVIAHSLGGVAARWAATFGRLDEVVCEVVTVCSPHRGAPLAQVPGLARLPWIGQLIRQLRPGSTALAKLASAVRVSSATWVAYAAEGDAVVPFERALLHQHGWLVENRVVPVAVGHMGAVAHPAMLCELTSEVVRAEQAYAVAA